MSESARRRPLHFLLRLHPRWSLPSVVALGVLAYCLEGTGISLFIPLLQTINGIPALSGYGSAMDWFSSLLGDVAEPRRVVVIAALIFASILVKNLVAYGNAVLNAYLNARVAHRLRIDVARQLLSLSQSYIDGKQSGQLLNALSTETWRTAGALAALNSLLISSCAILVFSVLLLVMSWRMTIVMAICTAVISALTRLATGRVKRLGQRAVAVNTGLAARMCELLGGMKLIRAFGQEKRELARFDSASQQVRDTFFALDALSALSVPMHEVLSVLLVLGVIAQTALRDRASMPMLVAFAMVLLRLQSQARQLGSAWVTLTAASSAVRHVMWLLDPSDKTYVRSGVAVPSAPTEGITFERVSFVYPQSGTKALDDISLHIPALQTTALVGPSGAGKTTLINLLCRFYDADSGVVRVDGQPIRSLDIARWRKMIGIVSQDIYMFGASIGENIAYGVPAASASEIVEAARLADAHTFISSMPNGYDTKIGDGGAGLSGGQRQRIALARAILRNPSILILDEATNALDNQSESLVCATLDRFRRGRTVIVIAHRLSTVERADRIVVLDRGRVAEEGDLETLLEKPGLFSRLYRLQRSSAPQVLAGHSA